MSGLVFNQAKVTKVTIANGEYHKLSAEDKWLWHEDAEIKCEKDDCKAKQIELNQKVTIVSEMLRKLQHSIIFFLLQLARENPLQILHREDLFIEQANVDDELDYLKKREEKLEVIKKEKVAIETEAQRLSERQTELNNAILEAIQIPILKKKYIFKH